MSKFWSVIKIILMVFGVLFLIEVGIVAYLLIADPFGLNSLMNPPTALEQAEQGTAGGKHPALTESQEQALEAIGVDPSTLPTEITAEQEACLRAAVGAERAAEIEAGATPTAIDYMKAGHCL